VSKKPEVFLNMAKRKQVLSNEVKEIQSILKSKKAVIGTDKSLKNLKKGKVSAVYITLNCPEEVKEEIKHYSKLSNAKVVELKKSNEELGVICKKPFSISVLSHLKGE